MFYPGVTIHVPKYPGATIHVAQERALKCKQYWQTTPLMINCDLIYRNRSKSHIGSYEIIDFKDFNTL